MHSGLKQLIPGNPGTSYIVALLYVLNKKFGIHAINNDQLSIFTTGIVKSRKVFFSGVLNEIASRYKRKALFLTNGRLLLKLAQSELNKRLVDTAYNPLSHKQIEKLIGKNKYLVLSVDLYFFKNYHDYHFVAISKKGGNYQIFEPKSGKIMDLKEEEYLRLITSVSKGLKDLTMAFCL